MSCVSFIGFMNASYYIVLFVSFVYFFTCFFLLFCSFLLSIFCFVHIIVTVLKHDYPHIYSLSHTHTPRSMVWRRGRRWHFQLNVRESERASERERERARERGRERFSS